MNYIIVSLLAAIATSLTTIFAKIGIRNVNSNFATFFRTGIVIVGAVIVCFVSGSIYNISSLTWENYLFLVLSGICTGCSWLSYFKALKHGTINRVAPIDKSSFVLTSILFLIFFFDDTTNGGNSLTICMLLLSISLMLGGTILMVMNKSGENKKNYKWIVYAILSAVFASLVSFFIRLGLRNISSSLGTLFRTIVVFIFSGAIVLCKKDYSEVGKISYKSWIFLILSGIATGVAWLLEYEAFTMVDANPIAVNSIGKLSILMTMMFSFIILKEKFTWRQILGLGLLTSGIVIIIIFSL